LNGTSPVSVAPWESNHCKIATACSFVARDIGKPFRIPNDDAATLRAIPQTGLLDNIHITAALLRQHTTQFRNQRLPAGTTIFGEFRAIRKPAGIAQHKTTHSHSNPEIILNIMAFHVA
jgi:hypothetical protein